MLSLNLTIFYNLGSLVLGCAALLTACISVIVRSDHRAARLSAGSFCLTALSLLLQIAEISHRVRGNDFSAVDDTIGAVLFASAALFVLTAAINGVSLIRHRGKME